MVSKKGASGEKLSKMPVNYSKRRSLGKSKKKKKKRDAQQRVEQGGAMLQRITITNIY